MGRMRIRLWSPWLLAPSLFLAGVCLSWAQGQSGVIVVKAKRAFSPPLSQMAPISPPSGKARVEPDDRMALHRPVASSVRQDSALQRSLEATPLAALTLSTTSGLNILGIGNGFPNYTNQSSVPDSSGAVGTTQFVEFVNESFAVFKKSDGSIAYGPANGNTLWNLLGAPCSSGPHLDEIAQFDKLANRWVMMMPAGTASPPTLCVAVSKTSDAVNGGWNLYAFPVPKDSTCNCSYGPDYPKLAVWSDAYYITYNQDSTPAIGQPVFEGDQVCALDSASMQAGNPATMQCFEVPASYGGLLAADIDGTTAPPAATPEYLLNFDGNGQSLDLWQFHVDWTTPSSSKFTGPTNIGVTPFTEPCGETALQITYTTGACIPQAATTNTLDSYGDRLMYRLAYRNLGPGKPQSLLANHTVNTGSGTQTGIRWYELQDTGSGFTVYQQGTYAPDSSYRWMGSIAMDQAGDIALGYSVSSSAMSPSIAYTGRLPTDPLGQMESEIDILGTSIAHGSATTAGNFHWADYSSMAVDPTDDCTFWFTTEYLPTNASNWATRIASFSFPSCATVTVTPDFIVTPSQPSANVSPGGTATFSLAIAAVGSFNSPVTVTCSAPTTQGVNCSVSPGSETPGNTVTLTVTTTAPSAALILSPGKMRSSWLYSTWICFPALGLVGIGSLSPRSRNRRLASLLLCSVLSGSIALQMACGSASSTPQPKGGTPKGTYTVNINATASTLVHNSSVNVVVQ